MTLTEKELAIMKSEFPISEMLEIKQRERDSALQRAENAVERERVEHEYAVAVNRIYAGLVN